MTYLELINKVLRELREKTVSDLSADYTLLIGQFVNQAKEEVERAWDWRALQAETSFNTVSGTMDYTLGSTTQKSKLLYDEGGNPRVYITTDGEEGQLCEASYAEHRKIIAYDLHSNASPSEFSFLRNASGLTLSIYPRPDAVYAIQCAVYTPQAELTDAATVITCPSDPVWKMALVYAASERGAGQSESVGNLIAKAERALWGAITEETGQYDLTFYEA
jgi:hypothetical protein